MRTMRLAAAFLCALLVCVTAFAQDTPPDQPPPDPSKKDEPKPDEPKKEEPKKEKPVSENLKPPKNIPEKAVKLLNEGIEFMDKARQGTAESLDFVDKAVEKFEAAVLCGPNFALAEYHRGIAYQFTQEFDDAQRVLEKALRINPQFYEAMVELGDTHAWMKEYDEAMKMYDKCLAVKPDYALAFRNKAIIFLRRRELVKAAENVKKAMELDPEDKFGKAISDIIDIEVKGPGFKQQFVKETEHYTILTDAGQEFADSLGKEIELVYRVFTGVFPKIEKSKQKFPIYVFEKPEDYFKWGGPPGSGGFFSDFQQKLQFFKQKADADSRLVLYHEGFHQFINHYFDDAPDWFNEGHAEYFGALEYRPKEGKMFAKPNQWRLKPIQDAIRGGNTVPLAKLLQMTRAEYYDRRTIMRNYAQGWSFVYFLWEYQGGKYKQYVSNYFQALEKRMGLKKAYQAVFGKANMALIETEWKAFILTLSLPEKK
jgi:tetratricopeptide (TPR) repeat protein